jgi:predicted solute-binding protein
MNRDAFKIGWIPYLNLLPMKRELEAAASHQLEFIKGHPTSVNKWLLDGTVHLAPSSSINLLQAERVNLALPLGVASDGAVQSVYIGFYREHLDFYQAMKIRYSETKKWFRSMLDGVNFQDNLEFRGAAAEIQPFLASRATPALKVPPTFLTPNSASSQALLRVFFKLWYGVDCFDQKKYQTVAAHDGGFIEGNRPLELVIGDEALIRRGEFARIFDLGEAWSTTTGLPFVYAVWQTSRNVMPHVLRDLIVQAAELSSARMRVEPSTYFPTMIPQDSLGNPLDLASYWKCISYQLNSRHLKGLLLFLNLYTALFKMESSDPIPARLARWGSQWKTDGVWA